MNVINQQNIAGQAAQGAAAAQAGNQGLAWAG